MIWPNDNDSVEAKLTTKPLDYDAIDAKAKPKTEPQAT